MKKIFTIVTALLLSFSLLAFSPKSMLSISSTTRNPIILTIDNKSHNEKTSSGIVARDLMAGYHTIKIFQKKNNRYGKHRPGNDLQLIYHEKVYVKPGFHVDITVNRFGKAFIDERRINSTWYDDEDDNTDWNYNDHTMQAMSVNEFNQFKQVISNASFDNTKLIMAKQTISRNYFTSAQVKEIVCLFSFESSKLDIAKCAYKNSIDKNNYFIVSDALGFSSSKEELAAFLQTSM